MKTPVEACYSVDSITPTSKGSRYVLHLGKHLHQIFFPNNTAGHVMHIALSIQRAFESLPANYIVRRQRHAQNDDDVSTLYPGISFVDIYFLFLTGWLFNAFVLSMWVWQACKPERNAY